MKANPQRPSGQEFIDFRLCASGASKHTVYIWLRNQSAYRLAEQDFRGSSHFLSLQPGQLLKLSPNVEIIVAPGGQADALMDFARRVAYCIGHFLNTSNSKIWKGSAGKVRARAARDYKLALQWSRKGFGPYDADDRRKLEELLTSARDYVMGKHLSPGFQFKGGKHHHVGMLIRDFTAHLSYFDLPPSLLTSIIGHLLALVDETVESKTVQRHRKAIQSRMK